MSGPRQAGSLLRKYRLIKHVPVTYRKQGVRAPRYGGELPFTHEQLYKSNPEISLLTCRAASRGRVTFFLKSARTQPGSFSSLTAPMEQLPMTPVLKSSLPAQNSVDQTHFIFDLHPEFLLTSHSYLLYMWGGPGVWARSLGRPRSVRPVSQLYLCFLGALTQTYWLISKGRVPASGLHHFSHCTVTLPEVEGLGVGPSPQLRAPVQWGECVPSTVHLISV